MKSSSFVLVVLGFLSIAAVADTPAAPPDPIVPMKRAVTLRAILFGDAVWNTGAAAQAQASASWQAKCDVWKKEVTQRIGARLVYASCGSPLEVHIRDDESGETLLAYQTRSEALTTIVLNENENLGHVDEYILATPYQCTEQPGYPDYNCRDSAKFQSQVSWDKACDSWKARVSSALGARYLTASCEQTPPSLETKSRSDQPTMPGYPEVVTFHEWSEGRAWFVIQ